MESMLFVTGLGAVMTVGMAILFVLAKASIKLNDLSIVAANMLAATVHGAFKRIATRKHETAVK